MSVPDQLGPVECIVVQFQNGRFEGEALAELESLTERGIITVLDLMFVQRADDGAVTWLDYDRLDGEVEVGQVGAGLVGLLSEGDAEEVGAGLEPGEAVAVVVIEDTWAIKLQGALEQAGGRLVEASRVPKEAVDEALAYAAANQE